MPKYNFSAITKLSSALNKRMSSLYRTTYSSNRSDRKELEDITNRVDSNIDAIISRNNDIDAPNITKLYTRIALRNTLNDRRTQKQIEDTFNDNDLTNTVLTTYLENKNIKDLKDEIDVVCKYMPKLDEALKAKRDAILSSDSFSKDFINANISSTYDDDKIIFSTRLEKIKRAYKLAEKFDNYTYETMKYGEVFVYHVPYKKALSKLLSNRRNGVIVSRPGGIHESTIDIPEKYLSSYKEQASINIQFNFGGLLESAIDNITTLQETNRILSEIGSVNENYDEMLEESTSVLKNNKNKNGYKFNKTIDDNLEYPTYDGDKDITSNDGLIKLNNGKNDKEYDIKTPGCVIEKLKQENVVPMYIGDICLGYYYFEFDPTTNLNMVYNGQYDSSGYGTNQLGSNFIKTSEDIKAQKNKSELLRYIASQIASQIDDKFINTNPDLAKEIYAVLRYNDLYNTSSSVLNVKVTFISDEDITHIKFEEDPDTHRGLSDLLGCLLAAKMYSCIKVNDTIASLTRGSDRRVYYVKQNAETNIAQTLMNVINQIKRSNFNIRQIENMNSILNIIGKYNDFVIPLGPSGDPPVQMEVMQGQDIQPNTELLDKLEEECINSVDVPLDLINSRYSVEFATQITSSNIKFLRHCILRQEKLEYYFSRIITCIYNSEYDENVVIKCTLPQPLFLNIQNLNNVMENVRNNVETMANYEYDDDQSEENTTKKAMFIKHMMRQRLHTYVKLDEVENIKKIVDFEYKKREVPQSADSGSGGY